MRALTCCVLLVILAAATMDSATRSPYQHNITNPIILPVIFGLNTRVFASKSINSGNFKAMIHASMSSLSKELQHE